MLTRHLHYWLEPRKIFLSLTLAVQNSWSSLMVAVLNQMFLEIIQSFFVEYLIPSEPPTLSQNKMSVNKNGFSLVQTLFCLSFS